MRNKFFGLIILGVLAGALLMPVSRAQQPTTGRAADAQRTERRAQREAQHAEEIKAAIESIARAFEAQDLAALGELVSPDWQLYSARANKLSAERLFAIFAERFPEKNLHIRLSDIKVQLLGNGGAFATYDGKLGPRGEEGADFIFTSVFRLDRETNRWINVHMHETMRPTN